jgi:RNA polymerase sigma factor (sigma-70 family)
MHDVRDMELLQDYARRGSEAAFAELVQRHIGLVYSAALRHVGIAAQAEEITQAVFIILARKASGLRPDTILEGWLYETTRLTSLSFMRWERRRQFREQEAYMQSTFQESTNDLLWNQLAPLLDEAMSYLGRKDRDAVILRFFKEKSVREVAATLQVNEAAAQRRILRALEKLRKFFTKRGVRSTTAILAGAISANSVQAAPVALAKTVTAVAIAKGAAASGSTLTLIKGVLKIMAWTKMKTTVVVSVGILLASGTMVAILESKAQAERKKDFVAYEILHQSLMQKLLARQTNDSETRRQLGGVWIITDKRFQGNPEFAHYPENNPHLKTWTLTNWAIVTYDSKSNVVYSASGPYELNGNLYAETVESGTGNMTNYIGTRLQYKLRVEGDKYYQMGSGIEETGQRVQQ